MHYKQQVALKYAELVYYGLWFSPLREALDAFVNVTQRNVTGEVRLKLFKGRCTVAGREEPQQPVPDGPGQLQDGRGVRSDGREGLHPAVRPAGESGRRGQSESVERMID